MKFGKVNDPGIIDFTLPEDNPDTARVLSQYRSAKPLEVYIGCAQWNRNYLKGFYPPGIKDELTYYASRLNAIELNATYYKVPDIRQIETWRAKTPAHFRFFPKIPEQISHRQRLTGVQDLVNSFCDIISHFEEQLGMVFLQLNENFSPQEWVPLRTTLEAFPAQIPLAVEVRNEKWFADPQIADHYYTLLERLGMTNILVDTAGRRDLLHMRLTAPVAFVRFVSTNHPSDFERLNDWVNRIRQWKAQGLQQLFLFIHQDLEADLPFLVTYFTEQINTAMHLQLPVPGKPVVRQPTLFD